MDHFAGLDVSVKETSICIVDDAGKIVREVKVASEPEALLAVLKNPAHHFKRIGLEAGPLSQWLFSALAEAGLPVICVETRHYATAPDGHVTAPPVVIECADDKEAMKSTRQITGCRPFSSTWHAHGLDWRWKTSARPETEPATAAAHLPQSSSDSRRTASQVGLFIVS